MDTLNSFLFIGLPYAALAIFIAGTIFRYTKYGYKVSSLSSEFLEGRRLFWGSQPFHWGILFLFFGTFNWFSFPKVYFIMEWSSGEITDSGNYRIHIRVKRFYRTGKSFHKTDYRTTFEGSNQ